VAHWKFDELEDTATQAIDSAGSYDGQFVGSPSHADATPLGNSLEFDGDDAVDLGLVLE
jgi:hypothetical protein